MEFIIILVFDGLGVCIKEKLNEFLGITLQLLHILDLRSLLIDNEILVLILFLIVLIFIFLLFVLGDLFLIRVALLILIFITCMDFLVFLGVDVGCLLLPLPLLSHF